MALLSLILEVGHLAFSDKGATFAGPVYMLHMFVFFKNGPSAVKN